MANGPFDLGYDPYAPIGTAPASEPVLPIVPPAPDPAAWPAAQPELPAADPAIPATPPQEFGAGAQAASGGAKQTLLLPVDYDPFASDPFDVAAARQKSAVKPAGGRQMGLMTKLMEENWAIRGAQSGLTLPRDLIEGRVMAMPGMRREDFTDIPAPEGPTKDSTMVGKLLGVGPIKAEPQDELIERALDVANLAMTGGIAAGVPKADLKGFRVFGQSPTELGRMASDFANGRVSADQFIKTANDFGKINPFQYEVLRDVSGYAPEQLRGMTPQQIQSAYQEFVNSPAWGNELRKSSGTATPEGQPARGAFNGTAAEAGPIPEGQGLVPAGRGGGGTLGTGGVVEAAATAARARGNGYTPEGLPTRPLRVGDDYFIPGPVEKAQQLAASYAVSAGIKDYAPPKTYVKVDPARAARIADAYEAMPHAPDDPKVKASYDAMIRETVAQMDELMKAGLKIEFIKPGQADPYEVSPRAAHKDVTENNHLWVFPTDTGFGAADGAVTAGAAHPMLAPTKFDIGGHKLVANDVFRAVHDYFGHFKDGNGFRADGEEHAWRSHSAMYSPEARPAMTTETRGQNSWLNYGPYGEKNRTAKSADTVYADQKVGLLPDWVMEEGRIDPVKPAGTGDGTTLFANKRQVLPSVAQRRNSGMLEALGKPIEGRAVLTAAEKLSPEYQNLLPERVQRLATEIPGLKAVLKYATPEESAKLRRDTAQKLVKMFEELPAAEEMAAVAHAGRAKKGWYRQSAQALLDIFGVEDAPRFAALLAALSPQTSVEANAYNALRTWTKWNSAGRPTKKEEIELILGQSVQGSGGAESVLGAWKNNSFRALSAVDPTEIKLSGPKVNSFMLNLRDNVNEVTNDAWMANYSNIDQDVFKGTGGAGDADQFGQVVGKGPGYTAMSAAVRRAADIATKKTGEKWSPAEIQETVWSWAKTLYEKSSEQGMTTMQLLKAGGLTHEQIADTPDFGRLFVSNIYRKILEEGGYGDAVEKAGRGGSSGRVSEGDGRRGSAASAEGSGLAQDAFERHLQRAAKRLEALRNERALGRAKPVDQEALQEDLAERYDERAAKLMDNGMSREAAERQAQQEVYGDTVFVNGIETRPVDHDPFEPDAGGGSVDFFSNRRPLFLPTSRQQVFWHGSASGEMVGGTSGLHLGSRKAATQALEARIGIPADGRGWVGDTEYGKTKLAGRKTIREGKFGDYRESGFNMGPREAGFPENDFFPEEYFAKHPDQLPRYPDGSPMPLTVKPAVKPYALIGEMTNSFDRPHPDYKANGYMKAQMTRGAPKKGYYYENIGEDSGSVSIVVPPGGKHIRPLDEEETLFADTQDPVFYSNKRQVLPSVSQQHAPTFFSGLEQAVTGAKIVSAPAAQWLGTLKNMPGVKPEEMQWLGLEDWLKDQPGKVSKDDIAAYVAANKLELKETVKDETRGLNTESPYYTPAFREAIEESQADTVNGVKIALANNYEAYKEAMKIPALKEAEARGESWAGVVAKDLVKTSEGGPVKFSRLQMPGESSNYREVLLQMPKPGLDVGPDGIGRSKPHTPFVVDRHWSEPDVLAWSRVNDRELPVAPTPEEVAATKARADAEPELDRLRQAQGETAREINKLSSQLRAKRYEELEADFKAKKITGSQFSKALEEYADHPELKPLQDKLQDLRLEESDLLRSLPEKPKPVNAKTLFIEEIQSDWHQQGRERGYGKKALTDADVREWHDISRELWDTLTPAERSKLTAEAKQHAAEGGVPDAPFKKSWPELVLKRMIREAAEKGYDQIAWTPGDVQNKRWSLSNHVDRMMWSPEGQRFEAFKDGRSVTSKSDVKPEDLPDLVGKEVADKLINKPTKVTDLGQAKLHELSGVDIEMGGKGMRGFYDKILVEAANKLGKAYGAKVSTSLLSDMPKLSNKIGEDPIDQKVWVMPITDELRDAAVGKGFSLFMAGVPVIRVDHDPFDQEGLPSE